MLLGLLMVYSASYMYAKEVFGDSTYFISKQILYLIVGIGFAFIISKTKFSFWYKYIDFFHWVFILLLFLTFTPLGESIKGSSRWVSVLGYSFQPGEFVKYTALFASIKFFEEFNKYNRNKLILGLASLIIPLVILIVQPDYGTFSILVAIYSFNAFMSNIPLKYIIATFVVGFSSIAIFLISAPYRLKRLAVFLDPWKDPQNSGFQIIQSFLAFANGHVFGLGMGNSHEKLFYLPEAYNDFIFSVLGEELGFVGVCVVVILFCSFLYWGLRLALSQSEQGGGIISRFTSSCIFLISLQAFLNMSVVLGILPTKGLNLPFISYGGSSLLANIICLGFIYSGMKLIFNNQAYSQQKYNYV
jgi:cell division protein FtsW